MNKLVANNDGISTNHWFYAVKPLSRPSCRLYCFPFAGGSNTAFRGWETGLPNDLEVCTIALPGRGVRLGEPFSYDLVAMSHQIADAIQFRERGEFALFGHSMGATLAHEVALRLRERGAPMPVHLFVSGRQAPNVTDSHRPPVDSMNDEQFQSQVISLNGIPDEIRAVPDLMAYILPALKADFIAVDRWAHAPVAPLSVPITALVGRDDPTATAESAQAWQQHTRSNFTVRHYRGDHFFIRNSERQVLETIGRTLSPYLGDM